VKYRAPAAGVEGRRLPKRTVLDRWEEAFARKPFPSRLPLRKEKPMTEPFRRIASVVALAGFVLVASPAVLAASPKALVGSYKLVKRVTKDGKTLEDPEVLGFLTFTKTHRTLIMKWNGGSENPASIAVIATYTLSGEKYCETAIYGVEGNLRAPGVAYDPPGTELACTAALSDASGLSFDVPNEKVRFRVGRDGIITTTPRWTDHWERVK
jgi:hypothetical protein